MAPLFPSLLICPWKDGQLKDIQVRRSVRGGRTLQNPKLFIPNLFIIVLKHIRSIIAASGITPPPRSNITCNSTPCIIFPPSIPTIRGRRFPIAIIWSVSRTPWSGKICREDWPEVSPHSVPTFSGSAFLLGQQQESTVRFCYSAPHFLVGPRRRLLSDTFNCFVGL